MILLSIISFKLLHFYINKVLYFKNLTQCSDRKWINLSSQADFLMCTEEKNTFFRTSHSNSLKWAVSDGHCCVILPGHSLRAAVRLLVWRPLWCVVSRHHSHWAGRWRSPAGWDASSQSPLQDPPVSPLEGAPTTQLEAAHTRTLEHCFPLCQGGQWQTESDGGDGERKTITAALLTNWLIFYDGMKCRNAGHLWFDPCVSLLFAF